MEVADFRVEQKAILEEVVSRVRVDLVEGENGGAAGVAFSLCTGPLEDLPAREPGREEFLA